MPQLNKEQLTFFMDEVLGLLEWSDEEEEQGIDPLWFVQDVVKKMRKEIARLSGVSVSKFQAGTK